MQKAAAEGENKKGVKALAAKLADNAGKSKKAVLNLGEDRSSESETEPDVESTLSAEKLLQH
jgi:hypothetical protein